MRFYLLLLTLYLTAHQVALAQDTPAGWRWYNEPKAAIKPPEKPAPPPNSVTSIMSATEQMTWFHSAYNEALNDATINAHDKDKLQKVMRLNHFISEKTTQTGMTFKQVLLENPELSYTKDRPVEHAARQTFNVLEREKKIATVNEMKDQGWGFFFIYNGNDIMSQKLAPSLQQFSDTYQIELLGVSDDGTFIDAVKNNKMNDGKVVVPFVPALILVNPNTRKFKPLAYGFISQNDLLGRFYNVATNYQAPDF